MSDASDKEAMDEALVEMTASLKAAYASSFGQFAVKLAVAQAVFTKAALRGEDFTPQEAAGFAWDCADVFVARMDVEVKVMLGGKSDGK